MELTQKCYELVEVLYFHFLITKDIYSCFLFAKPFKIFLLKFYLTPYKTCSTGETKQGMCTSLIVQKCTDYWSTSVTDESALPPIYL